MTGIPNHIATSQPNASFPVPEGASAANSGTPLLVEVSKVSKHFGGTLALNEASFHCTHGSIHALVGENGAGKSALVKILAGIVVADTGKIHINGKEYSSFRSPDFATSLGVIPVFQELSLITSLTVAENVFIANAPCNRFGQVNFKKLHQQTEQLLAEVGFSNIDTDSLISELSLAQRQLVEIAKAFSRRTRFVVMDEGRSGVPKHEVERIFKVLRQMRDEGRSVIFISHRIDEVKEIADNVTIFRDGQDVGTFRLGDVQEDQMVQLIIGRKLEQVFPPKSTPQSQRDLLMEVKNLSWEHTLSNLSLNIGKGEIVGLGGLDGQGQSELLFALFGLLRGVHGQIYLKGKRQLINSPATAASAGINLAFIPEDRKTEGLFLKMSVGDNITMATIDKLSRLGLVNKGQERDAIRRIIGQMQVKTASERVQVRNLSGGNQQKVVIGKWLLTQAAVYLLHDPTRGIDVGTKQEIYRLIRELADQGSGILFFSTELAELVGMCDRVLVFYEGRIVRELHGGEITQQNIVSAALGMSSMSVQSTIANNDTILRPEQ